MLKTDAITEELPAEVDDLLEEMRAAKLVKVESLGKEVAKKRDEAVKGRKASGIETIWEEDREYYEGVDDANRDQHPWVKSPSTQGGLSRSQTKASTRCTAFFNITRQFCDSASARLGDILLPAGDWNFSIKPTPVPEPLEGQAASQPATPQNLPMEPGTLPEGASPPLLAAPAPPPSQASNIDGKAEKAETQLRDWLTECRYHSEIRKVLEDAAIIGTGVLKGPYPDMTTSIVAKESDAGLDVAVVKELNPKSRRIDPRDFFPDPCCGDDIHRGSYCIERDTLTARALKKLKELPGYIAEQIDEVLDEGPGRKHYDGHVRVTSDKTSEGDEFEIWYFHGLVDVGCLGAMNVQISEKESQKDMLPAVVVLVNERPIKAFINPLDSGSFPYDVMVWQPIAGSWAGMGVSRQMRTPQTMLNSSARAMMDNAGLSCGPQIIVRQGAVIPADGKWEITGRKVWWATESSDTHTTADTFTCINIPSMQAELANMIQMARQMAEESTGVFFLLQGQQGAAPDTVGGMELLQRNAAAPLRRLARIFDERVAEPHLKRYYEYLLIHGPEDCKGDLCIEVTGSSALIEREIQAQQAMILLNMSVNPIFELSPAKAMLEVLKANRFNPEKWTLTEEEKQQQQQAQQAPIVPAIEVAKIKSQDLEKQLRFKEWETKIDANKDLHKLEVDVDRDRMYNESLARRDDITVQVRIQELQQRKELAMLDYANRHNITLEQIKGKLADSAMKLRTMKQLAAVAGKTPQLETPATEPPQHAPNGRAFQE